MLKLKVIVFDYDLTLYNVNENYHNNYWAEYTTQMLAELKKYGEKLLIFTVVLYMIKGYG